MVKWYRFTQNFSPSPKTLEAYCQIHMDEAKGDEKHLHPVWPNQLMVDPHLANMKISEAQVQVLTTRNPTHKPFGSIRVRL